MDAWQIFYQQMFEYEGYKNVLDGLKNTVLIAIFGLIIGMILGCLLAITKIIPKTGIISKTLSVITDVYVAVFRGTPMVVQLLLIHFVIFPAMEINIPILTEAILAFGLNSGAYVAEIMRGGILSVDGGQTEAGRALGLNYRQTMMRIVLPQAVKNVVPTLGNEFIVLVKETSIVSFIAVSDLTKAFRAIGDANYEYIIPYLTLAVVYLAIVMLITLGIRMMERRFRRSERA